MNMLRTLEFPFCSFFFMVYWMFIWTAVNRNKLRYGQLSQERHMIQCTNGPGTAVQLQGSNARFRAKDASHRTGIAPFSNLNFFVKLLRFFLMFSENFANFPDCCETFAQFWPDFLGFLRTFRSFLGAFTPNSGITSSVGRCMHPDTPLFS